MKYGIVHKTGVELSRVIIGATFIFSGFVKSVDPHGFEYKIQDYLISLGVPELFSLALPAAVLLSVMEFLIGIFVLLGIYRKWTSRFALLLMLFMTPLTLWIALKNPVKDCGCFGDALVISNWATFYKNIVLLACAVALAVFWKKITPLFSGKTAWMAALFSVIFGFVFAIYNIVNRPVIDFRPYKIGSNIPEKIHVDPAKADVYENRFIYEKDGVKKEFTEADYPWNDSTWTFVDMTTKLVKEGEKPEIEDFSIVELARDDSTGQYREAADITEDVLAGGQYAFFVVSYDLAGISPAEIRRLQIVKEYAQTNGYPFYVLTSSTLSEISDWANHTNTDFTFGLADERVLKTIIRANPGLVLLKNGTIINKWDSNSIPSQHALSAPLDQSPLGQIADEKKNNIRTIGVILLLFLLPLGILKRVDLRNNNRKNLQHS